MTSFRIKKWSIKTTWDEKIKNIIGIGINYKKIKLTKGKIDK